MPLYSVCSILIAICKRLIPLILISYLSQHLVSCCSGDSLQTNDTFTWKNSMNIFVSLSWKTLQVYQKIRVISEQCVFYIIDFGYTKTSFSQQFFVTSHFPISLINHDFIVCSCICHVSTLERKLSDGVIFRHMFISILLRTIYSHYLQWTIIYVGSYDCITLIAVKSYFWI
jgi:hypothetical protein